MRRSVGAVGVMLLLFAASPASAGHDTRAFELDGNALDGAAAGVDWNLLHPRDRTAGAIARVFVADGASPPQDRSYFTGGGSKDINDVSAWAVTTGDVAPDKNEISDAFAVAYRSRVDTGRTNSGDLLFFFGMDRYANNGDAQVGFWFFRKPVGITGSSFTGSHSTGDLLVLSDFTQGGRVGTVRVFRWVGAGGSDGPLDLISSGKECTSGLSDDAVCSLENQGVVPAPWTYAPKSGAAGSFPRGTFYEGVVNVSRLLPGVECFSSYLAETRSSQSIDAQLKDFALGDFDTCPSSASSAPPGAPRAQPAPAPSGPELARSGPSGLTLTGLAGLALFAAGLAIRTNAHAMAVGMAARRTRPAPGRPWRGPIAPARSPWTVRAGLGRRRPAR